MNNDDKEEGTEAAVQDNDHKLIEGESNTLPASELVNAGKQLVSSLRCLPSNEVASVFDDLRDNRTGRTIDFSDTAKSFLEKMKAHNQMVATMHTDPEYSNVRLSSHGLEQTDVENALEGTVRLLNENYDNHSE